MPQSDTISLISHNYGFFGVISMNVTFDKYDKMIIKYLQEDASISNKDLATKIGLAPSSCLLRVKNLQKSGIIKGLAAIVDEKQLGFEITCYAQVTMSPFTRESAANFVEVVNKIPEVIECYTITGEAAFLMKIVAKDFQYYRNFVFDKLLSVPGVSNIDTKIVISTEKKSSVVVPD